MPQLLQRLEALCFRADRSQGGPRCRPVEFSSGVFQLETDGTWDQTIKNGEKIVVLP